MSEFDYTTPKQKKSVVFFMIMIAVAIGHYLIYDYAQEQRKLKESEIEAEATKQRYRINGQEVTQQEYEAALALQQQQQQQADQYGQPVQDQPAPVRNQSQPDQQQYAHELPTGEVRKCLDAQNKPIYQTEPCSTKGLRTAKVLTGNDGSISQAQTYSYKQSEQRQEAQTTYEVDGRKVTKAEFDQVQANNRLVEKQNAARKAQMCQSIEQRREWIRSQQRNNSTQYWRDEYTAVSKEWQDKCLGWSQAWSS